MYKSFAQPDEHSHMWPPSHGRVGSFMWLFMLGMACLTDSKARTVVS